MSILIKGMEMPKEDSWKTVRIYPDGSCAVPNWQGDCTLIKGAQAVPVPPHGRLIDADALIARYEAQRTEDRDILCDERAFPSDYEKAQYRYSRNSDFISALKSQAAIIPAEEGE